MDAVWYIHDWYILSQYLNLIFSVYLNPIFSVIAIIINVISIIAFKSSSIKKEIKKQYFYLVIYSISNVLYIITIPMKLINNCKQDNVFCSSLYGNVWSLYFTMIFTILLSNIFKTFSNSAYFMFVLMRYIQISSTKNIIWKKIGNLSFKTYFLVATLLSLLSNAYLYFEIKAKEFSKYFYTNLEDTSRDLFRTDFTDFELKLFISLQYLKLFLVDLLFFVLSILIDCILIFFIKKSMASSHNLEIKKKCKQRIIIMIVLNGINYLLLRLPTTLMLFYGLLFNLKTNEGKKQFKPDLASYLVCRVYNFCENLDEAFDFLFLISFSIQFIIFYKLDTNFTNACKSLFSRNRVRNIARIFDQIRQIS